MGRADLERKIQVANKAAEVFRVVLRLTVALLIFSLIFTLIMFLHYNRAIAIWPSLHPYHTAEPTTPMPDEEEEE